MPIMRLTLLASALILLSACATGPKIRADHDPAANFAFEPERADRLAQPPAWRQRVTQYLPNAALIGVGVGKVKDLILEEVIHPQRGFPAVAEILGELKYRMSLASAKKWNCHPRVGRRKIITSAPDIQNALPWALV